MRGSIDEHLTNGLTLALAASQPSVYNRSTWAGSDVAVNDIGLFEAVHRLLSTSYARYCVSCMAGSVRKQYLEAAIFLRHYDMEQSGPAIEDIEVAAAPSEGDPEAPSRGGTRCRSHELEQRWEQKRF